MRTLVILSFVLPLIVGCAGDTTKTTAPEPADSIAGEVEFRRATPESIRLGEECQWDSEASNNGLVDEDELLEAFVRVPDPDVDGAYLLMSANLVSPGDTIFLAPARENPDTGIGDYGTYVEMDAPDEDYNGWGGADIGLGVSPGETVGDCVKVELYESIEDGEYKVSVELAGPNTPAPSLSGTIRVEAESE